MRLVSAGVLALSFAAACGAEPTGQPPAGACATAEPARATWIEPTSAPGATTAVVPLELDQAVTGVEAAVRVEGATLDAVEGGPTSYTVRVSGLTPGAEYTLGFDPAGVRRTDCPDVGAAGPASLTVTAPLEAWRHAGPVQRMSPAPRAAAPWFVEQTSTVGISALELDAGRAMIVDFDGDGREDIVTLPVTSDPLAPRFLRNTTENGIVRFEDFTEESKMGSASMALLVFGDLDGDGDPDAFSGLSFRAPNGQAGVWENVGGGRFEHRGLNGLDDPALGGGAFHEQSAATLADFDGDGNLDLYVGHWYAGSERGNSAPTDDVLYRGNGDLTFTKLSLPSQTNPLTLESDPFLIGVARAAYGIAPADYDDDGDLDIFVNNYGAGRPAAGSPPRYWDHNLLWRNDGGMTFVNTATLAGVHATLRGIGGVQAEPTLSFQGRFWPKPIGGNGFGCQWMDFDNDGDLDLIVGTIAHPDYRQSDRTMLHVNQGPPDYTFTEESAQRGLEYYEDELHPMMIDVDNDGLLDLAMSRLRGGSRWRLYYQGEDHRFSLQAVADTGVDISRPGPTLWLDADGDGDLDFFMPKGRGRYFENRVGAERSFLKVSLRGTTIPDATGAKVTLESSSGLQQRFLSSGEGHYNTQQSRVLHFGLGGDSGAQNVRVRWPDGEITEIGDVIANVHIRVTRGGGVELLSSR